MIPRILFNAKDHPELNSGYGIVSKYILPKLRDRYGADNIIIYAPVYQTESTGVWEGMQVVGCTEFNYGESMVGQHYKNFECNMLLQVGDTWPLGALPDLAAKDEVLWVQWIPVDWVGMPKNIINRIKPAYKLVPFSKVGERRLREAGLGNVDKAIWLGLNLDIWKPLDRKNYPRLMRSLGYSYDSFNLLIVAANQERKRVRQELEAISSFRKLKPEANLRLYLHTQVKGERDIEADLDELGIRDITVYPEPYIMSQGGFPELHMAMVFNCADLLLNVCMEGFGMVQTQAQACGVPVVSFSEGASSELTVFGWEVPSVAVEVMTNQLAQPFPDVMALTNVLIEAYKMREEKGEPLRSEAAISFVRDNLSWDKIAEQWFGVIDGVMDDRVKHCMDTPIPDESLWEIATDVLEIR